MLIWNDNGGDGDDSDDWLRSPPARSNATANTLKWHRCLVNWCLSSGTNEDDGEDDGDDSNGDANAYHHPHQ